MKVELTNPQQLDTQFLLIWGLHFAGVDWEAGITNLLAICFVDEFGEVNATKSDQNLISHGTFLLGPNCPAHSERSEKGVGYTVVHAGLTIILEKRDIAQKNMALCWTME